MEGNTGFVVKVLLASALLAIAIKYAGPLLQVPPQSGFALGLVLLPPTILAIALGWRSWQQHQSHEIR